MTGIWNASMLDGVVDVACSVFVIFSDIFKHQSLCFIGFMATGAPTWLYFCHVTLMVGCLS